MSLEIEVPTVYAKLRGMVAGGKGYGISHRWDGTVLTVTSDSGSSSADLVGPAGELFVVRFEETGGVYTADKTFAEVKAAVDQGDVVVGDWTNTGYRGQLTGIDEDVLLFTFHSFTGESACLALRSDNTVDYLESEVGKENMPSRVAVVKTDAQITVTATYGWNDEETVISLNDDGDPVSVTKGDQTTVLTWEGFDE